MYTRLRARTSSQAAATATSMPRRPEGTSIPRYRTRAAMNGQISRARVVRQDALLAIAAAALWWIVRRGDPPAVVAASCATALDGAAAAMARLLPGAPVGTTLLHINDPLLPCTAPAAV